MFSLQVKYKLNDMFIMLKHWEVHGYHPYEIKLVINDTK